MLEKILEENGNDLKRIADSLERIANSLEKENAKTTKKKKSEVTETVNKTVNGEVNDRVNEPIQTPTEESVQNTLNISGQAVAQAVMTNIAPVVPINAAPVTYTQEEIARAMSSAMDAGRSDVVFNILKAFNTNSLMGINQNQYGDVARMLREAGIKI